MCAVATPALAPLGAPFGDVRSPTEHARRVARGGERPPLPKAQGTWPAELSGLLARCWDGEPLARPSAAEVGEALASLLVQEKYRAYLHRVQREEEEEEAQQHVQQPGGGGVAKPGEV